MKAKGCEITLSDNKGFTLPSNIGELGDDITELNLYNCSLQGAHVEPHQQRTVTHMEFPRRQYSARTRSADELEGAFALQ